jgi:replicative DNA helicase Mcm
MSRFDLFFIIRDIPNPEEDSKLAEAMLEQHRTLEPSAGDVFDPTLLRKYLSFCKRSEPSLSKEAADRIKAFFLEMRASSSDSPLQVTPRQLESIIRLATARAKLLLRRHVQIDDVETAIALIRKSLSRASLDVNTGQIDVDIIMTGKPKSQRSLMTTIMDMITDLEKESGKAFLEDIYARLEAKGTNRNEASRVIQKMSNDGLVYSPDGDTLKRT